MDTIQEDTRGNEVIVPGDLEDEMLWAFEEEMLKPEDEMLWAFEEEMLKSEDEKLWAFEEDMLKLEDEKLWAFEEEMLKIKRESWLRTETVLELGEVSLGHAEFLRRTDKLLRWKENELQKLLWKFENNCLTRNSWESEGESAQQLLPGIPNEITFHKITTKLSWREVNVLKAVCRGWYNAIRNYLVYDARVHSHLTETFVLVPGYSQRSHVLHCLSSNSRFGLCPIPYHDSKTASSHQFVAVDGKIYVLGGVFGGPSDKVYMLDLVGQRSWTQCASMQTPRSGFQCGVMDGKIYVFGGSRYGRDLYESEVYDPTENTWSSISPKCFVRRCGKVVTVGEEFFVYGGLVIGEDHNEETKFVEIYHPVKDEWTKVEPFAPPPGGHIFTFKGKAYSMDGIGIHLHSFDGNSWTQICSHSFTAIESLHSADFRPFFVLVVEDELLAFGDISTGVRPDLAPETCVLRSTGFNTEKELRWHEESGWGLDWMSHPIYPIHL